MTEIHTPVLVVGGGVTGLSSALFLAWHGVSCLLVERHPDLLIHPRARGLTPRTMELYRQVGLEPALQAVAFAGGDFTWVPVLADTLSGPNAALRSRTRLRHAASTVTAGLGAHRRPQRSTRAGRRSMSRTVSRSMTGSPAKPPMPVTPPRTCWRLCSPRVTASRHPQRPVNARATQSC
jgi:hypothetical protein